MMGLRVHILVKHMDGLQIHQFQFTNGLDTQRPITIEFVPIESFTSDL